MRLIRVRSKKFVAALLSDGSDARAGKIVGSSHILKYLLGKSDNDVRKELKKNKWIASQVRGDDEEVNALLTEQLGRKAAAKKIIDPETLSFQQKAWADRTGALVGEALGSRVCEHPGCKKIGPFGIGVHLLHDEIGNWFCLEHWRSRMRVAA